MIFIQVLLLWSYFKQNLIRWYIKKHVLPSCSIYYTWSKVADWTNLVQSLRLDQTGPILNIGPGPMIDIGPGPMYYIGLAYYRHVCILATKNQRNFPMKALVQLCLFRIFPRILYPGKRVVTKHRPSYKVGLLTVFF